MGDFLTWDLFKFCLHVLGFFCALSALFQSRTPQGATAWFVGLLGFPLLAIPLYVAFGRKRFSDDNYADSQKQNEFSVMETESIPDDNRVTLLIDGHRIYSEMISDILKAEHYIILQVYIFRTDQTGKMFARALQKKAAEGVKVFVLYEKVLISMSKKVIKNMIKNGVNVGDFKPFKRNKWHLNFRNHRKILIIDGCLGYFGGLNIGDDYVGKYPRIGHWRDTNVKIEGSSLRIAQIAFENDWHSSQGFPTGIDWRAHQGNGSARVLISASGPVDEKPICLLQHLSLINLAQKRLWIANPYIVPPQSLMDALMMAALRGVDVRILVPSKTDNIFVGAIDEIYYERLLEFGVRIFRYHAGFLHQKVMLIDDQVGVVGSANLDFRSMYINFEVTTLTFDRSFVESLEQMLRKDFICSEELVLDVIRKTSLLRKIYQRSMNLIAPIL
jgi:cardiolipin synthase